MRRNVVSGIGGLLLALAAAQAASAQVVDAWTGALLPDEAVAAEAEVASPLDEAALAPLTPEPLTPEESAQLAVDAAGLAAARPGKPLRLPGFDHRALLAVTGTGKPDGASTVLLKPALPQDWEAKVGADFTAPVDAGTLDPIRHPLPVGRSASGAAFASVGVPNFASVDARVDPSSDQGRLATTFKHAVPVGDSLSLTLQNTYAVTETFAPTVTQSTDLPLMALPQDATGPSPGQVWSAEQSLKLTIAATGTTVGAGLSSTSTDPVTHNTLIAEQSLLGPLRVTTKVTDVGQAGESRSIAAGVKFGW